MNITEDKFSNKSAEEIVDDMLSKHNNNTVDALNHTKEILNNDGLSFSKETKEELKKAADMLKDKAKEESLMEAIWPFKHKEKPTCDATFELYLPFTNTPKTYTLKDITGLDDPRIEKVHQIIRKSHPKSTIYMRSDFGNKRFYESTDHSFTIKAKNKDGRIETRHAGNLPIAMNLSEKLFESDRFEEIEIQHEKGSVGTYKGLKEGWILTEDKGLLRSLVNNKTVGHLAAAGLGALTGINPILLTQVEPTVGNYALDQKDANEKAKKAKEKLDQKYGIKHE